MWGYVSWDGQRNLCWQGGGFQLNYNSSFISWLWCVREDGRKDFVMTKSKSLVHALVFWLAQGVMSLTRVRLCLEILQLAIVRSGRVLGTISSEWSMSVWKPWKHACRVCKSKMPGEGLGLSDSENVSIRSNPEYHKSNTGLPKMACR